MDQTKKAQLYAIQKRAEIMIHLGARTPTIAAALRLTGPEARRIVQHVAKSARTSGMSPHDPNFFLGQQTMHSSFLANLLSQAAEDKNATEADILLSAYGSYIMFSNGNATINIDRAWNLMIQLRTGQLKMATCRVCNGRVVVRGMRPDVTTCPVCKAHKRVGLKGA